MSDSDDAFCVMSAKWNELIPALSDVNSVRFSTTVMPNFEGSVHASPMKPSLRIHASQYEAGTSTGFTIVPKGPMDGEDLRYSYSSIKPNALSAGSLTMKRPMSGRVACKIFGKILRIHDCASPPHAKAMNCSLPKALSM